MLSEELMKQYQEACDKSKSNIDMPLIGEVFTPLCCSCIHVDMHYGSWDEPECSKYDIISDEYMGCKSLDCPHYEQIPNCPQDKLPHIHSI